MLREYSRNRKHLQVFTKQRIKRKALQDISETSGRSQPIQHKMGHWLSKDDLNALNELKWKGSNLLGKILTKVRDKLRHRDNLWS